MQTITRTEMIERLIALDIDPDGATIAGRSLDGVYCVDAGAGARWVHPVRALDPSVPPSGRAVDIAATRAAELRALAEGWAGACRGITCISVGCDRRSRYDTPGQMSARHHAQVTFAPASLSRDSLYYVRDHCDLLLIVQEG